MDDLLIHKDEINMQMARYGVKFGISWRLKDFSPPPLA